MSRVSKGGISVNTLLADFIEQKALNGSGISPDHFWSQLEDIINRFSPRNKALLAKRDDMQLQINQWHQRPENQPAERLEQRFTALIGVGGTAAAATV